MDKFVLYGVNFYSCTRYKLLVLLISYRFGRGVHVVAVDMIETYNTHTHHRFVFRHKFVSCQLCMANGDSFYIFEEAVTCDEMGRCHRKNCFGCLAC